MRAGPSCFTLPAAFATGTRANRRWREQPVRVLSAVGTGAIAFSSERGGTRLVFDGAGPAGGLRDRRHGPRRASAALVAATFAELYPSFQWREIDWAARTEAAERAIDEKSDDDALFKTLKTMLAGVEDPHVEMHAEVAGEDAASMPGKGSTLGRMRQEFGDELWTPPVGCRTIAGHTCTVLRGKARSKGEQWLSGGGSETSAISTSCRWKACRRGTSARTRRCSTPRSTKPSPPSWRERGHRRRQLQPRRVRWRLAAHRRPLRRKSKARLHQGGPRCAKRRAAALPRRAVRAGELSRPWSWSPAT